MGIFEFHYFDERVRVSIPDEFLVDKINPEIVPPIADVYSAVGEELSKPIGAPPLESSISEVSRVRTGV